MPKITVTTRRGEVLTIPAQAGTSLMELIRDGGIDDLAALCGGSCSCATCHIYVAPSQPALASAPSEPEDDLLSGSDHRRETSRLGCQVIFEEKMDGLRVTIAPEG
jgi:2Fe-2S ferredoxin